MEFFLSVVDLFTVHLHKKKILIRLSGREEEKYVMERNLKEGKKEMTKGNKRI